MKFISSCILSLLAFAVSINAYADEYDNPPPQPGFTHSPALSPDTPDQHGIILSGGPISYGSPTIGEVDGNLANGKEIVVNGNDGRVYVYKSNGSLLWEADMPAIGCGKKSRSKTSPAIGTTYGDGIPHVVATYGSNTKGCDGGLVSFKGTDGTKDWSFSLKNHAKQYKYRETLYGVLSSPALTTIDDAGHMVIGFAGLDRNVYLLNYDGTARWFYNAADTVFSSPGFMDVDSDGAPEMIIGTDISQNLRIQPQTSNGGYVYALKTTNLGGKRVYFRSPEIVVWKTSFDQVMQSSPVIADVLSDVPGDEIITASGCFFPQAKGPRNGRWVKILRASDGAVMQTLNAPSCANSSVAVGDLNDDGHLDIVGLFNANRQGGIPYGTIAAWSVDNPEPMWTVIPYDRGINDKSLGAFQAPVVGDLDGNGSLEVVAATAGTVGVFSGRDGAPLTCQSGTCAGHPLTLYMSSLPKSTPALGDIDGDGDLEVVIAGSHSGTSRRGALYVWTDLDGLLGSPSGSQPASSAPYPMFRGRASHSGKGAD